jgi:hypothetical protein
VLQLGPQIVIVDRSKKIGVLAMGVAPVVVLDTQPGEIQDAAKSPPAPGP